MVPSMLSTRWQFDIAIATLKSQVHSILKGKHGKSPLRYGKSPLKHGKSSLEQSKITLKIW